MVTNQLPTGIAYAGMPASDKHCVFRCGDCWFSIPAVSVREIVMAPKLVQIPYCHRGLVGLGRLRSEFVPVLSIGALLDIGTASDDTEVDCLLVFEGNCIWSLLISESATLESMETIVSQESRMDNSSNVVLGTAMFRDRIVRVLNPNGLLATAQQAFDQYWNRTEC